MFNKTTSLIVSALSIFGVVSITAAAPVTNDILEARGAELSPNAEVCTGNVGTGCVTIPISSDSCIDFTGGLSFLNDEVSSAVIPDGFVCTFFSEFGCLAQQGGADQVVLQGGTWSFFSVPGTASATVDFNDLSSSFICSPV